jgi:tyrosine-protein phosphatase YwqE
MISFFSKKPKLVDLIPQGFIDIHSHVLPKIDDGSKSIEETTILLEKMAKIGFEKCIVTPHTMTNIWDNSSGFIEDTFEKTKRKLPSDLSKMLVKASSEYMMDESFIERLQNQSLLTIKDEIVLVEMSYLNPTLDLKNILFQLQMKGYTPLLAHPERYLYFHNTKKDYALLKDLGCLFQLNLLSTIGYYGKPVADVADYLLSNNLIDFVGSDIHHKRHVDGFQERIKIKSKNQLIEAISKNGLMG